MESNTSTTQTKGDFTDNLVEFDYETWRKFGLKLYWPASIGDPGYAWPLKVLTIRVHPAYQMVGLVKEDSLEEVITFSKETGKSPTGRTVLMDLDTFFDRIDRANTLKGITWNFLVFVWNSIRLLGIIIKHKLKRIYYDCRSKKLIT
jgi:hypothetical protein